MVTTLQIHNDKDNKIVTVNEHNDNDNDNKMMRAKEQILLSPVDSTLNAAVVDQDMYSISIETWYDNTCSVYEYMWKVDMKWNLYMTAGYVHFIIYKLNILSKSQKIISYLKNHCPICLVWMHIWFWIQMVMAI